MHYVNSKGILSKNNGINVYRGCSHGCIYCDSRSLCYNFDHAFEDIEVKINAPELLDKALKSKKRCCMIGTGAMSDPYMHIERTEQLTRKCLEVIEKNGFGATVLTKSNMVLRDLDLLKSINEKARCVVQMTLTTYDDELCKILEPNVCVTSERAKTLKILHENGIPTVVWLTPILPFINDTEENLRGILNYCFDAGVSGILCFNMGLTLREGDREYYYSALDKHFPGLKERYIKTYGNAYSLPSPDNDRLMRIFHSECEKAGIIHTTKGCFDFLNEFPDKYEQFSLF